MFSLSLPSRQLTLSVDGGKSVENYVYAEKGLKWTVVRSVEGNVMTAVSYLHELHT